MTFKDTSKMSKVDLRLYEMDLLDMYQETFGENYKMPFWRPDTDVVVADLIHCLKTGQKQAWKPRKLPDGAVI